MKRDQRAMRRTREKISRKQFLTLAGGGLIAAHAAGRGAWAQQETPRPNVVLIISDTLRADVLGSYGATYGASPELDAIARKSVQFDNVFAPSSWTLPSIGAMLTSQLPRTLGLFKSTDYLQDKWPSFAQLLQAAGYRTYGITANAVINSIAGFARGFDEYRDIDINWESEGRRTRSCDEIFGDALKMAAQKSSAPGYLQINVMEMHEYYRGDGKLTRPEFCTGFEEVSDKANRRDYVQALRQLSAETSRFIESLLAVPGWENTVVLFLSDHGEGLDDHPDVWQSERHGSLLYESMIHVPLLFYHPSGSLKPARVRQMVSLLDVVPTVLGYLGVTVPGTFAGRSLLPLLQGKPRDDSLPEFLVAETTSEKSDKSAVYSNMWQYIRNRDMQAGCNERELQRIGVAANGKKTDEVAKWPGAVKALDKYLMQWDKKYPKGESIRVQDVNADVGDREEQLKALGYLQ